MIKALNSGPTESVVIIGLSRLNCERLLDGKPIVFPASDIGLGGPLRFLLVGGETEADIAADLRAIGLDPGW